MSNEGRRTQAVRAPGAGSYTPAASVAASNPCLNCGTNIQLEYCPECGQRELDPDPTLKEFLHDLAEELLHWDGKLMRTFRTLLTKPGELTKEYLEGRRVRYVSPVRLYLLCSVLFFALNAVLPRSYTKDKYGNTVEAGVVQVSASSAKELADMERDAQQSSFVRRVWLTKFASALRTPGELQHRTTGAIPKAMFVLVPFFAALVALVYRDRYRKYPQHLTFALHVHAVFFLSLALAMCMRLVPAQGARFPLAVLALVPFAAYAVRAARNVYASTTSQAVYRLSMAAAMYFAAFVAVLYVVFALIVLSY